jgi:glycine/D-amino acid oxidase-like deaminating enzyme
MARMVPGFAVYLERMRRPFVDGGYYTKAPDNMPLLGPTEVPGLYLLAALSGYGIMASQGAAEAVADALLGAKPRDWAAHFSPARFADAAYRERLRAATAGAGQL